MKTSEVRELLNGCFDAIVGPCAGDASLSTGDDAEDPPPRSPQKKRAEQSATHRNISDYVDQILRSGSLSEVCVEGVPVNSVRKIVARQMSFAFQLLVELLLLGSLRGDSGIADKVYSGIMELSNLREAVLKKAHVLKMTVRNASEYHRRRARQQGKGSPASPVRGGEDVRITRSFRSTDRSYSVFDLPCLAGGVAALFAALDRLQTDFRRDAAEGDPPARLSLLRLRVSEHLSAQGMRAWTCLFPARAHPLSEELCSSISSVAASSYLGRMQFTPAEDCLLLRGVLSTGDEWGKIRAELLPAKCEAILAHRFSEGLAAQGTNPFKRYAAWRQERGDCEWSGAEDLQLLRGFGVHGCKWLLVSTYFLPQRNTKEIQTRCAPLLVHVRSYVFMRDGCSWQHLVKEAARRSKEDREAGRHEAATVGGRLRGPVASMLRQAQSRETGGESDGSAERRKAVEFEEDFLDSSDEDEDECAVAEAAPPVLLSGARMLQSCALTPNLQMNGHNPFLAAANRPVIASFAHASSVGGGGRAPSEARQEHSFLEVSNLDNLVADVLAIVPPAEEQIIRLPSLKSGKKRASEAEAAEQSPMKRPTGLFGQVMMRQSHKR